MSITNARAAPIASGDKRKSRIAVGANHMDVRAVRSEIRRASRRRKWVLTDWKAVMNAPLQRNAINASTTASVSTPARDCLRGREEAATDQTIQPVAAKLANWADKTRPACGLRGSVGVNPASRRL